MQSIIRSSICAVVAFLNSVFCFSQSPFRYVWPIDSPGVITANYGELRPNHFHAGIDFTTSGKINLPIYSIEEGYVSRIRVSPYGYGKCVYITHPNGKVSVYAHLNAFSMKIANLAKENQYAVQNFEIDFTPKPRSVYVRRNEIIGLSGNTGGSTGPHLHFEIRDELTEIPLNPLGFFRISDRTSPEIHAIAFYNLSDTTQPVLMNTRKIQSVRKDTLILEEDHLILNQSIVGLAFSGIDRCYPNGNSNNVFSVRIYLDDTLIYSHQLNNIAFDESRFINVFSDNIGKNKFQKLFLPTIYPEGLFGPSVNKGRTFLTDSAFRKIKIIFTDESGNASPLQFYLKARQINSFKNQEMAGDIFVNCAQKFDSDKNNLTISIPPKVLFYSSSFFINNTLEIDGKLSLLPNVSLKQNITLGFKLPAVYWNNREKVLLKGSSSQAIPLYRNDSVFYSVRELGKFYLSLDTVPPKVRMNYSDKKLKDAWMMDSFSFAISDNGCGIGKYNLWLNNSWVVAEYDAKTDLLTYYFDEDTPMGLLQFKLEVQDKVGNKTFFEYTLKK
ncbi:hypothetical protein CNR22_02780 [Sphingobacteriaceae bacterium]|nr:hypothetical protein CNR22_02780 [Sphingobacteriaceae bacterium]